jgi:FtsP/CotA-like multicopper oxidase with cupredoxin domain
VVTIASGEEREIRWKADTPGTFLYWASVGPPRTTFAESKDALLNGGLVIDPPGTRPDPRERIFVLNEYLERAIGDSQVVDEDTGLPVSTRIREVLTVNGLTWPYTEPLRYELGERVKWRVINASVGVHPMHLHGFYFDVLSRNDGNRDAFYGEGEREKSVTERIPSGGSIRIEWDASEEGRWLYHCHMAAHFSSRLRVRPPGKGPVAGDEHKRHALEDMSGLVLGIEIQAGATARERPAKGPARELTLHVREHPNPRGRNPLNSYFVQEGFGGEPPGEFSIPGLPLVLTRGQRTQIKVVNHLTRPTAVHWHGIELESIFDGVVGWGGHSTSVTPSVEPGGSFIAEMTPPRAGTFIYHTHFDDDRQLRSGLYGPLLVLEPGERYDPEKDRVVLVSTVGGRMQLNGGTTPSFELKTGQAYRFRLINITLNNSTPMLRLTHGERVLSWRALAKDGALLPPARATVQPAAQIVTVGETRDFEFTPDAPGELMFSLVNLDRTVAALPVFVQ